MQKNNGLLQNSFPGTPSHPSAHVDLKHQDGQSLSLVFSGSWRSETDTPAVERLWEELKGLPDLPGHIDIECSQLQAWDSNLPAFLLKFQEMCQAAGIELSTEGLPQAVSRMISLASAQTRSFRSDQPEQSPSFFQRLGQFAINFWQDGLRLSHFVDQIIRALLTLLTGKVRFRIQELPGLLHRCGSQALPIVSLISLLVGLILAFVGAIQLQTFGAQIYVADLVGIAMVREMGAIMTGIIMAGRTGAAFAAQLGTMNVNEEVDALQTMGISPFDFLVLPRILTLILMMPLLCLYADFMGIVGGSIVGLGLFDISFSQYLTQTKNAVALSNLWLGLIKSIVFGMIIAIAGCYHGFYSGRSASAVGLAATSAVVSAIVVIIAVDGLFAVICHHLGL